MVRHNLEGDALSREELRHSVAKQRKLVQELSPSFSFGDADDRQRMEQVLDSLKGYEDGLAQLVASVRREKEQQIDRKIIEDARRNMKVAEEASAG